MRWLITAVLATACGSGAKKVAAPAEPAAEQTSGPAAPAADGEDSDEFGPAEASAARVSPIPEVEARLILSAMFRAGGFRIVYDVPVAVGSRVIALDGYDPEAKVGFEYRATEEMAAWSGELPAELVGKILIVAATDRDGLEQRAEAFLKSAATQP